ncbi:hypothetical protein ARMGADRAFT_1165959 [Armillaria gallica]|uniref:Uncharacterized protein n=1 Tax=Armillaria gallica TaxID=47427 RepID=A0A2H3DAI9_ARMGA|nr:hypothetical protein ARMGADRAFT_1165959 [Armillaria gallica]
MNDITALKLIKTLSRNFFSHVGNQIKPSCVLHRAHQPVLQQPVRYRQQRRLQPQFPQPQPSPDLCRRWVHHRAREYLQYQRSLRSDRYFLRLASSTGSASQSSSVSASGSASASSGSASASASGSGSASVTGSTTRASSASASASGSSTHASSTTPSTSAFDTASRVQVGGAGILVAVLAWVVTI